MDDILKQGGGSAGSAAWGGDGTAPHALGLLDGVPTFWSRASRCSLPKINLLLRAIDELRCKVLG